MKPYMKKIGIGFIVLFLIVGIIVFIRRRAGKSPTDKNINLTVWRLFDDEDTFEPIIDEYEKKHSNVKINYKYFDYENYEQEITNALAEGSGPDIWMIKNDWLPFHYKKLAPLPESIMSQQEYEDTFADIAQEELTYNGQIYGIPLSCDTLAVYFNKHLFQEGLTTEPRSDWTWDDFIQKAQKLTKRDGENIIQSGAAMGTANNTDYAFDILSLIMLQNDTPMVSDDRTTTYFNLIEKQEGGNYYPGTTALDFYTAFAIPGKKVKLTDGTETEVYSWNNSMPSSFEAFINEQTAMMFGYAHQIDDIKNQSNKPFGIVPVPQIKKGVNEITYPNFWAEVVSKDCQYQEEAWKFIEYCSTKQTLREYYKTKDNYVPSSRLDMIEYQKTTTFLGPFVQQIKKAKSWNKGNAQEVENIFKNMINQVLAGHSSQVSIDSAAKDVTEILNKLKE